MTRRLRFFFLLLLIPVSACVSGKPARFEPSRASPPQSAWERLDPALVRYRKIAADGGWPEVPPGPKLQPGDRGERVLVLRQRLGVTGELRRDLKNDLFDEPLAEALKRFQERHGLEPDGVVGRGTLNALNVPVETRILQLELNRERIRDFLRKANDRHVVVNIPDFRLKAFENGKEILDMKVIVGQRKDWQTPLLESRITHLILNPKWNVPPDIFKKEVLLEIQKDPEYLARENMVVVRTTSPSTEMIDPATIKWAEVDPDKAEFKIIQREGPGNSLGRIKFMFPNRYAVYLHDTPGKGLFQRSMRALSHGCVRVERPMEMADFLLNGDPRWPREALEKAIRGGRNQTLKIKEPADLHLVYWTAWVDEEGQIQFRDDIYRLDR